jgi:hypothetical protein
LGCWGGLGGRRVTELISISTFSFAITMTVSFFSYWGQSMKFWHLFVALLIVTTTSGCISSKSYVDPKYSNTGYSEIKRVAEPYTVKLDVEFQRNGELIPRANPTLVTNADRVLRASGVFLPVDSEESMSIKVTFNNIDSMGGAFAKGFGTGLTFGLVGTAVSDYYEAEVVAKRGDAKFEGNYDHAIHSTIGNKGAPVEGVEPMAFGDAFAGVVEDILLEAINDMQKQGFLSTSRLD